MSTVNKFSATGQRTLRHPDSLLSSLQKRKKKMYVEETNMFQGHSTKLNVTKNMTFISRL